MATIHDLLKRVTDDNLRAALEKEVKRLTGQKKFGLVFEEHLPEATALHGMKVKVGMTVATRAQDGGALYIVKSIEGDKAICIPVNGGQESELPYDDLVAVAKFGDPIYPVLQPMDKIEHGGGDLWHALIQADNYHALQLLEYLYAGKVDCIYIDPPYNTGARDWKYNNDYVDKDDAYRHSKWLSMMKKRLVIAKRLLNPKDSVMIVTIDEKEYLHLGVLLEDLFPEARIQMISSVINPAGAGKPDNFYRTDEYLFFVQFGSSKILPESRGLENVPVIWDTLRRSNAKNRWENTKTQFYPIFVNDSTRRIHSIGMPLVKGVDDIANVHLPKGCTAVYPIRDDGTEMMWGCKREELLERLANGYVRVGKCTPNKPQKYVISYLTSGIIGDIAKGKAVVSGRNEDGTVIAFYPSGRDKMPTTNWNRPLHDAQRYGSELNKLIVENRFTYPKSIYAVKDCLKIIVGNKAGALIVDFFAGSGTTLHAVNLLNAEDGGKRRCILVTNNEVSEAEEKDFRKRGLKPGDAEWEAKGIAQYVTWPRTTCSIKGVNVKGEALKGEYLGGDKDNSRQMSDGFAANCEFFKLAFVNKDAVSLGRQFKEILPLLWMRSGAKGARPTVKRGDPDPTMMILPQNGMAILLKESAFSQFVGKVADDSSIGYVYLVTDSEKIFRDMARSFEGKDCVQIYRHYLDNFRINKFKDR